LVKIPTKVVRRDSLFTPSTNFQQNAENLTLHIYNEKTGFNIAYFLKKVKGRGKLWIGRKVV